MKCPIILWATEVPYDQLEGGTKDCLQAECAWWLADIQMCAVRDVALELRYVQMRLADLANRKVVL